MQYIFKSMTVFSCYISYMYSSSIQVLWYACTCFQKNAEIINHKVDTLNDKNISSKKCPENHIPYSRHAVTFFENHYLFFYAYII